MDTAPRPSPKKRGPAKTDWIATHLFLPPELLAFAKENGEGMGALVRRLLRAEYERQRQARDP